MVSQPTVMKRGVLSPLSPIFFRGFVIVYYLQKLILNYYGFDKLRKLAVFHSHIIELAQMLGSKKEKPPEKSGFFLWWSVINEFRTNNLADLKELALQVELFSKGE